MSDGTSVRVRGIYTTALTALLLEGGFTITAPSRATAQRFNLKGAPAQALVTISDRGDRQGVVVEGYREEAATVVAALGKALPDALFRSSGAAPELGQGRRLSWAEFQKLGRAVWVAEFPAPAKLFLDQVRARWTATIPGHHFLKIVDPERVEEAEQELGLAPERAGEAALRLKEELVYRHHHPGMGLSVLHVKPSGAAIEMRGTIREAGRGRLVLERRFTAGGSYDSLDLPKEAGDHGTVELEEGAWWCHRRYLAADGTLKGDIYNINTPVEFYPQQVRYVDLEVDVVLLPGKGAALADEPALEEAVAQGLLPPGLAEKARAVAGELMDRLRGR